jgi:hypothetical protein
MATSTPPPNSKENPDVVVVVVRAKPTQNNTKNKPAF